MHLHIMTNIHLSDILTEGINILLTYCLFTSYYPRFELSSVLHANTDHNLNLVTQEAQFSSLD
jgi:hypothetical protein